MDSPTAKAPEADGPRSTPDGGLRVLQVGGLAGPGAAAGGVWAVARMQATALRGRGDDVELVGGWLGDNRFAPAPQGPDPDEPPTRYFRLRRPFPGAQLRGLISLHLPRYVAVAAARADVVQVHLSRDFITTFSTLLLAKRPAVVVAQSHGMLMPSPALPVRVFDAVLTRRLVRIPRLWLTLTDDEERGLQQLGVEPQRMRRVVNAAPAAGPGWSDPHETVFLFAARLSARKQPLVFARAALAALDAGLDARFVIAGPDQGQAGALRELIAASPHADRFDLPGELTPGQVRTAMANCTAYVLPARNEPYPMSVIEAAAAGTPMIITTQCGLSEALRSGRAAVLAEPTVEAFCAAMLALAADPQVRAGLGSNAKQLHLRLWSARRLADDLRGHYGEAIGERAGDGR